MDNDAIYGSIKRVSGWVDEVRHDVENHAFNGHKLDSKSAKRVIGSLAEMVNGFNAVSLVLRSDDDYGQALVRNNRGFANYLTALVLMESDPAKSRELLESAEKDLKEAADYYSLIEVSTNLERVQKALAGELSDTAN